MSFLSPGFNPPLPPWSIGERVLVRQPPGSAVRPSSFGAAAAGGHPSSQPVFAAAVVDEIDATEGLHVVYEDGDQEWIQWEDIALQVVKNEEDEEDGGADDLQCDEERSRHYDDYYDETVYGNRGGGGDGGGGGGGMLFRVEDVADSAAVGTPPRSRSHPLSPAKNAAPLPSSPPARPQSRSKKVSQNPLDAPASISTTTSGRQSRPSQRLITEKEEEDFDLQQSRAGPRQPHASNLRKMRPQSSSSAPERGGGSAAGSSASRATTAETRNASSSQLLPLRHRKRGDAGGKNLHQKPKSHSPQPPTPPPPKTKIKTKKYACPEPGCTYAAVVSCNLKTHLSSIHSVGVTWRSCPSPGCIFSAKLPSNLKRHLAIVHGVNATCHPCDVPGCDYSAKQSGHLKLHQANVHGVNVVWKVCAFEGCEYRSKQGGHLKKHAQRHGIMLDIKPRGESYEGWIKLSIESKKEKMDAMEEGNDAATVAAKTKAGTNTSG